MEFLTKSAEPYQYYQTALMACIKSMVGNVNNAKEYCKQIFDKRMKDFDEANANLPSASISPNHPTRLLNFACFVSEYIFRDALANTLHTRSGDPIFAPAYACEYFTYDCENSFNSNTPYYQNDYNGFYIESRNKLWDTIKFQPASKKQLTKMDSAGRYNVINFSALSARLKRDIKTYYSLNQDVADSVSPNEEMQKIFGRVLGELTRDIMQEQSKQYNI